MATSVGASDELQVKENPQNYVLIHFKSKNYAQLYIDLKRDGSSFPTFVATNPDPALDSYIVTLCSASGAGDGCYYLDYTGETPTCLNWAQNSL